jgi:hypothetical protein
MIGGAPAPRGSLTKGWTMPLAIKSSADPKYRVRRRVVAMSLVAAAGVGGLSLGLGGVAGAASSSSGSLQSQVNVVVNKGFAEVLKHFNCGTAETRLDRVAKLNAAFAARQAHLTAQMQKAHGKRITFYDKRLAASHKEQSLYMGKKFQAQEAKVAKLAQDKCHITPPVGT